MGAALVTTFPPPMSRPSGSTPPPLRVAAREREVHQFPRDQSLTAHAHNEALEKRGGPTGGDMPEALATRMQRLTVEISLSNGSHLAGKIYVPLKTRLTDVLNDGRGFLPVECTDGSFMALSKQSIERVTLPSAESAHSCDREPGRTWITLTDTQNRPIHVNMEHAISLKRTISERKRATMERTAIGFTGGENEPLTVVETPEQILALLSAPRRTLSTDGSEKAPSVDWQREIAASEPDGEIVGS